MAKCMECKKKQAKYHCPECGFLYCEDCAKYACEKCAPIIEPLPPKDTK